MLVVGAAQLTGAYDEHLVSYRVFAELPGLSTQLSTEDGDNRAGSIPIGWVDPPDRSAVSRSPANQVQTKFRSATGYVNQEANTVI
jgi:hypothetical protein